MVTAADAATAGHDPRTCTEDELSALFAPHCEGPAVQAGVWDDAVPLTLVATDYAPFTDVGAPTGNVRVIDPSDERTFCESLDALGLVHVLIRQG